MDIDEKDLVPIKAKDLFIGAWFWVKTGDKTFERAHIDELDMQYRPLSTRARTKELSKDGRLFMDRKTGLGHPLGNVQIKTVTMEMPDHYVVNRNKTKDEGEPKKARKRKTTKATKA